MNDKTKPVEIFAGSIMDVEILKSILENEGIESYIRDEINGTLFPWITSPAGTGAVKLIVSSSEYEKAIQIVYEFEKQKHV